MANPKIIFSLHITLLLLLLQGCSSTISVSREINYPSAKGLNIHSITLDRFSSNQNSGADTLRQQIIANLNRDQFVSVVPEGGEGVLTARLQWDDLRHDSWREEHRYKDRISYSYHLKLQRSLTVNYRLTTPDGEVGDAISDTFSEEYQSSESQRQANSKAPTNNEIDLQLLRHIATRIARDIAPHRAAYAFEFHKGKDDNLELGIRYVEKGRNEQAEAIFQQVLQRSPKNEDRAAALYNLGLLQEIAGRYNEAFVHYRDANQMNLKETLYLDALSRIERRVDEEAMFQKQTQQVSPNSDIDERHKPAENE
ncbi:MAG: tetratricopeptide repeat protein [Gammaproteobacteria bacterium]|nr:tetratricopeptide repeat protein [Gammaproteobacteria bacterium]